MPAEQMIDVHRPDGRTLRGWLVEAEFPVASIVVIQEWWGLNEQIRGVARRLAAAGFTALVPDLYRGQATLEAKEAEHLMSGLNFGDAASQDIRGAVQCLRDRQIGGGRVGVTGFCGGALTVLALAQSPEAAAGVVWYGYPPLQLVDAERLRVPLQAHWATQDAFFGLDGVEALESRLRQGGVSYEGHRYPAHHAFANETAQGPTRLPQTQFDAAWAQAGWDRMLRFLGQHLARPI